MSKYLSIMVTISITTILIVVVIAEPEWLCDKKPFLKEFMGKDILPVLGVILTITLASAAQLHLEFNKIEERYGAVMLNKSRSKVHQAAFAMIYTFLIAAVLLVVKPIIVDSFSERSQAAINAVGLFLLWINVVILIELTQAAFSIPAHIGDKTKDHSS